MNFRYRFLRFPEGKTRAFTMSYDDGCREDVRFSDLITSYGLKCTFNLNAVELHGEDALPTDTIFEKILGRGHEVAVHGYFHRAPGMIPAPELARDVMDGRRELEARFGRIIRGMAYPDSGIRNMFPGNSYEEIKGVLKSLGIVYARTLGEDNDLFRLPADFLAWMPTCHQENDAVFDYIDKFLSVDYKNAYVANRYPRLFYLWGHGYEFTRREGGWERIEEICKKIAGHEDVWYATNMEIYDYVTAYNALVFNFDCDRVYNPTLHTIWFDIDRKLYKIEPGETLTLA